MDRPITSRPTPNVDVSRAAGTTRTVPNIDWASFGGDKAAAQAALNQALNTLPPVSDRFNKDKGANLALQTALQARLDAMGIKITVPKTGEYDAATKAAVKVLQSASGIKDDGKVGQLTWSVILGAPKDPAIRPLPGFHLLDLSALGPLDAADLEDLLGFEGAKYDGLTTSSFDGIKTDYALLGQQPDAHQVRMALRQLAMKLGMTVTAEGNGRHVINSYHYKEDEHGTSMALDVAGTPAQMAQYAVMSKAIIERAGFTVKELFYDPLGGIKNGQRVGAIGGHGDHVHVAV